MGKVSLATRNMRTADVGVLFFAPNGGLDAGMK